MQARAAAFLGLGLGPRDVVVLALGHSPETIHAFWGALYAGIVPTVFSYRSPARSLERHHESLRATSV